MTNKTQDTAKRAKRSFLPKIHKDVQHLRFRGDGAKYIGETEPTWPTIEEQNDWSKQTYTTKLGDAFNWYATSLQDDKHGHDLAVTALSLSGHFPELIAGIKASSILIPHTAAWLIRMARMGANLRFHERKFIVKAIKHCLDNPKESATKNGVAIVKPTIQEFISAKIRRAKGEIDAKFDEFVINDYTVGESKAKRALVVIADILHSPETSIPSNRTKDLIEFATRYLDEYKLAISDKDKQITEAYSRLGKRELKASIVWWEQAITDINNFGLLKKSVRKTRKKKVIAPSKIVSKLKFVKAFPALKIESFDPTQILKSSEIWTFNTRTKKLGHFVALPNSTFDVKGTRILNIDTVKSVQKTLRKPNEQLKAFNNYGKPGAIKWFKEIRAVETRLKECLNKDSVLLRAVK